MAGLPGTGKTTLARELARVTRGAIVSKDEIRAALFSAADIEYSVRQDDFVMEIMLDVVRYLLKKSPERKIFLDGRTFSRRYQIDRVLAFAAELDQPWKIIECISSEESTRRRLETPDPLHPAKNRSFALYQAVKASFEPITFSKITVDTDQPLDKCVEQALTHLAL